MPPLWRDHSRPRVWVDLVRNGAGSDFLVVMIILSVPQASRFSLCWFASGLFSSLGLPFAPAPHIGSLSMLLTLPTVDLFSLVALRWLA